MLPFYLIVIASAFAAESNFFFHSIRPKTGISAEP